MTMRRFASLLLIGVSLIFAVPVSAEACCLAEWFCMRLRRCQPVQCHTYYQPAYHQPCPTYAYAPPVACTQPVCSQPVYPQPVLYSQPAPAPERPGLILPPPPPPPQPPPTLPS